MGIRVTDGSGVVISNNTVIAGTGGKLSRGVYVDGANSDDTRLFGNQISGASVYDQDVTVGNFSLDGYRHISASYDPPSLAAGASDVFAMTATGAAAGDVLVSVSHNSDTDNYMLALARFDTDSLRIRCTNVSAGVFDGSSMTVRAVWKKKYK